MDVLDKEQFPSVFAQLVIDENTPEAQKRREERRQDMVREKQLENDRFDFQRENLNYASPETLNRSSYHFPANQYWLTPEDRLVLAFYEAQCAEKIKKRQAIVFANHLVYVEGGPSPSPNTILELTKWVKISLSKKKTYLQYL